MLLIIFLIIIILGLILIFINKNSFELKSLGLAVVMLGCFIAGIRIGSTTDFKVKKQVKPKVKIECINEKCDTFYIYNFKK